MPPLPAHSDPLFAGTAGNGRLAGRRPLLGILLVFIAGLLLAEVSPLSLFVWLAAAWLVLLLTCLPLLARYRTMLLYLLIFLLASARTDLARAPISPDHLVNRMQRPVEYLKLTGVVADDPIREEGWRPGTVVWRFPLAVESVQREVPWQRARGRVEIRLETTGEGLNIQYGERWQVQGPVQKSAGRFASPPRLSLSIEEGAARRLAGQGGWFLRRWCLAGRRLCAERLGAGIEDDPSAAGLARALVLGYRQELPERAQLAFARTGTLHVVAISGAHVGMVALLMLTVVRATGLSQPRWPWVMAPLLLVYALGTGMTPSAVRACLMATSFYFAYACWRQPDALSALALSALLILVVDPSQLLRPGFLLSYAVVAGLIVWFPRVRDTLHRRFISRDETPGWFRRHLVVPIRNLLIDLVGVTWVAWLVSTPLVAAFFNLVSPIALLANLAVVPLAFLILFSSCLGLLLGFIHPALLEAYNHAARFFASLLFAVVEHCERLPGASFYVPAPPIWLVALVLLLIGLWILGGRLVRRGAAIALVVVLFCIGWHVGWGRPFEVAVRHLGPTSVALVHTPHSGDWLFDTGPAFTERRLISFLNERGINRLRAVVITRASVEASGALSALLDKRKVDEVWIPVGRVRSQLFAELVAGIEGEGVRVVRRKRGDRIDLRDGAQCEVLHPEEGRSYPDSVSGGLVLRFSHWASAALLIPMRDRRLEENLLAENQDFGGQALVELGLPRDRGPADGVWASVFRPTLHIRPAAPADLYHPADGLDLQTGLIQLAIEEGVVMRAEPKGGFTVRPPDPRNETQE